MAQPMMFESPYKSTNPPQNCLCDSKGGITVNVGTGNAFPLTDENGQVMSRTDAAARIIAAANAVGFPLFQGS